MDTSGHQPTPLQDTVVMQLLPVVMLVASVGMTAFMIFAFKGDPASLLFGGMMVLSALGLLIQRKRRRRAVLILLCVGMIVAAVAMMVLMFNAFKRNPASLMFGLMMVLSTVGIMLGGLRDDGEASHGVEEGTPR